MKYFRMSYEEVVFRRSYINIMLLNKSIPSFNFDKDDDEEDTEDDEYTAALKRMKKQKRDKPKKPKVNRKKPSTQHANDFFSQFM